MTGSATTPETTPEVLAEVIRDAPFVRLAARDDGDALAAAALLARAARGVDTPFQLRVTADPMNESGRIAEADDVSIAVGADDARVEKRDVYAIPSEGRPASTTAFAVTRTLGIDADPVLALAGVAAAGSVPGTDGSGDALDAAERRELVSRRSGVAVPTSADALDDGLSASTLFVAPFSGDPTAARAVLADLGIDIDASTASLTPADHRRLASLVAVDTASMAEASTRSASAVERVLRPYATPNGPFATVGGYADVLDGLARHAPGTGIALALADRSVDEAGRDGPSVSGLREAALDVWRTHGLAVQRAVDSASLGRYDGSAVVRIDTPMPVAATAARVIRDFRSPEQVVLVSNEATGRIAGAAIEPIGLGETFRSVAADFGAEGWGSTTRGGAQVDGDDTDVIAAMRGRYE